MNIFRGMNSRERTKEKIRIRDNYTCQECGKIWKQGERRFDIHHIIGKPKDCLKNDKDYSNQITLCHQCHLKIDSWKMMKNMRKVITTLPT